MQERLAFYCNEIYKVQKSTVLVELYLLNKVNKVIE